MNPTNPFPDGKLPPMPRMEIDELTAKDISQEKLDQSLQLLWDERPDLILALMQGDLHPDTIRKTEEFQDIVDSVERYLMNNVAPRVDGYDPYLSIGRMMWELRLRTRRTLGLPVTQEEIKAARARGERVT